MSDEMETPISERQFGRNVVADERDAQHLMLSHLPVKPASRPYRYYQLPHHVQVLDQKDTPTCVGHGWKHFLLSSPIEQLTGPTPFEIYDGAQVRDNDPSTPPADGTTVRGGAAYLKELGFLSEYVWANDVNTMAKWIIEHSPVVLGVTWYANFNEPDAGNYIRLVPQDDILGGHCLIADGVSMNEGYFRLLNSWGDAWGLHGHVKISFADMQSLFELDAECCAAVEVRRKVDSVSFRMKAGDQT